MTMEIKFCKDCVHIIKKEGKVGSLSSTCFKHVGFNLVTGEPFSYHCTVARGQEDLCGREGRGFESNEVQTEG
jgi:hypothetical protein